MDKKLLEGKVIILIGATGALGTAFTKNFAAEGATVVMVNRTMETLKSVADEVAASGGKVDPMPGNFKSVDDAKRICAEVIRKYGKFDVLVTNASKNGKAQTIEYAEDDLIHEIIDTDVKGLIWWNREAMKHFIERDEGCILNIGSNNIGRPICDSVYCAAKYAEWGLTMQLAMRCVGTGVRCNLLNPGMFKSAMVQGIFNSDHMYDAEEKVQASGRIPVINGSMSDILKARTNRAVPVDLDQVAYAAVYLASDLARDVNGQMFTVDRGGYL